MSSERDAAAQRRSIEINPENELVFRNVAEAAGGRRGDRRLALVKGFRWPKSGVLLSVQFLDTKSKELRRTILKHMNAWNKTANIKFTETNEAGHVRITRTKGDGHWSWVGTQILEITDPDEPTMNLDGFTMNTPESEFLRVVRHEAGHTLGFDHEHLRGEFVSRIDVEKAIAYYAEPPNEWTPDDTRAQVLTPLEKKSIMGTTVADPLSIMCYHVPAEITTDGVAIPGGVNINKRDFEFAGKVYPKTGKSPLPPKATTASAISSGEAKNAPVVPVSLGRQSGVVEPRGASSPGNELGPSSAIPDEADTFHLVVMDEFDPEEMLNPLSAGGKPKPKPKKPRPKYARVFASYAGARVDTAMRLRADKGEPPTPFGKIIAVHEGIKGYTNREEGGLPGDKEMIDFGINLFDTLFQGDVLRLYDEARSRQRHRKLDLVFTSMIPWIAEKPWEFAYDKVRCSFLATEDIHLIRNVLTAVPASIIPPRAGPLRLLVVAAQPVGFGRLSIEQEVKVILRGFQPLIDAGCITVEVLPHATPSLVHGRLQTESFDVVHFIGHGKFDEETQTGSLIFENDRGGQYELGERSVREIFCQRGVRLVFLNACQTGSGGRADFNKGVAQSLVAHGLPALVANQYSVLDSSATSFAQHFYWAMAQGMSIGQAAREARIAVNYSLSGEPIDWAVPVVYARDPNMTLCQKPAVADPTPVNSVRRSARAAIHNRPLRVACWDIDNVFPALDQTLKVMNDAQTTFGFEVVALSAPTDAWDMSNKAADGSPYLWANKVADRLSPSAVDLGVNVLICITRHWMCDDESINIYGWWPDHKEVPVALFSCAGMEDLKPEGPMTDKVLANVIVLLLAGFLGEKDTHPKGAKDCPLYRNSERDFSHMTGRQKFEKECRAALKTAIPKELPALEELLKTFHPAGKKSG